MKLELKHIAPYLPYGLKIKNSIGKTIELTLSDASYHFDKGFKPILRPLSDLENVIEHNGDSFIPINWLEDKYYTLSLHKECERLLEEDGYLWIYQMSHLLITHLHEWHFDVLGLIPEGLAIDINDLKK